MGATDAGDGLAWLWDCHGHAASEFYNSTLSYSSADMQLIFGRLDAYLSTDNAFLVSAACGAWSPVPPPHYIADCLPVERNHPYDQVALSLLTLTTK